MRSCAELSATARGVMVEGAIARARRSCAVMVLEECAGARKIGLQRSVCAAAHGMAL